MSSTSRSAAGAQDGSAFGKALAAATDHLLQIEGPSETGVQLADPDIDV